MQLTAKLIQVLPMQSGMGKNGEWKKQDIVVETDGQYPKKVCFSIWGDKAGEGTLQIGNMLDVSFDVESREFNGRWYTDLRAWKVDIAVAGAPYPSQPMQGGGYPQPAAQPAAAPADFGSDNADDLPF